MYHYYLIFFNFFISLFGFMDSIDYSYKIVMMGNLLSLLFRWFCFKLLGEPFVGKSNLLLRYCKNKFNEFSKNTIGVKIWINFNIFLFY